MPPTSPDRLQATTESLRQAEQRLARYDGMKEELAQVEATVTSPDRTVTIVAGPNGAIKDVRLTDAALQQHNAQKLSRTVMSTIQQASAEAARKMAAVVQQYAGDKMDIAGRVAALQQEVLEPESDEGFQLQRDAPSDPDEMHVLQSSREAATRPPAFPPQRPRRPQGGPDDDEPFSIYGNRG
jgi:DNA-binding protein YbaB